MYQENDDESLDIGEIEIESNVYMLVGIFSRQKYAACNKRWYFEYDTLVE
jgi:hypothetical protein